MDKSLNKNVLKLLICFVLFFSFNLRVKADPAAFNVIDSSNVFVNCNEGSDCVPLCIYSNDDNTVNAIMGYHYDSGEWEIGFLRKNVNKYYYSSDVRMPKDNIYDGNKSGFWVGGELYGYFTENFACPSLLYLSQLGNNLCFESTRSGSYNTEGDCAKRKDININKNSTQLKAKYQFSNEYESVAKGVYDDLFIQQIDDDEAKNKYKIEFLHFIDSEGIKYDSSKSAKDNALANCNYIKENTEHGKLTDYMKKVSSSRDSYINSYINPSFATNANKYKSRNFFNFDDISFYKFDILYGMMVKNNDSSGNSDNMSFKRVAIMQSAHADNQSQNQPAFRYIYDLYGNNVAASVNYIVSTCGDEGIVIEAPSTNDALIKAKEELGLFMYQDPKIDIDNQVTYDCSFLTDVADIISNGYFILEMAGLAILVVLSIFDYVKIFLNDNADELNKANSKFVKRLIVAVLLFLLPAFVNLALRIFKIEGVDSDHPLCVQISNK